jgi:hypothetical protein
MKLEENSNESIRLSDEIAANHSETQDNKYMRGTDTARSGR